MAIFLGIAVLIALSTLSIGISRVLFHPLSKFPGPALWAISQLPQAYYLFRGRLPHKILELHAKYGPVVRLAPNELSFTTAKAWDDIYLKPSHKSQLQKDHSFLPPSSGVGGLIFETNDAQHNRLRRIFSHAFSDKSLREQEPIVLKHVNQLVIELQKKEAEPFDICKWFNFTFFDITGDLLFSDSFESLQTPDLHLWIQILFDWVAGAALLGMAQKLWPLTNIALWLVPRKMKDAEVSHRTLTQERLQTRLRRTNVASLDLISKTDQYLANNKLNSDELLETCRVLLVGGSETMATVVSGMLYYLLCNPSSLSKLTTEIRSGFNGIDEINQISVQKLVFLSAVITEALRLFPPLPGNLRRITPPEGTIISGRFVPGKTVVGVDIFAANYSPRNFSKPTEFHPERWFVEAPEEFRRDKRKSMQPFSVGPRNCIAKNLAHMEMQVILAILVFRFDIELLEESKHWVNGVKAFGFLQKPKLMVKLAVVHKSAKAEDERVA